MNDWTLDDLAAQNWAEAEQARLRKVRKARKAQAIRTVCAWCGEPMGGDPDAELVSHGICERCLETLEMPA